MLRSQFTNILNADKTEDEKYNLFLELLPKTKKCAKCKEYLLKSEFKQGYCLPCKTAYHKKYRDKKCEEEKRHCAMCDTTKDANQFYKTSLYRCKDCSKNKQSDYSMKYYYTKGRDRRRTMTEFYKKNHIEK